MRKWRQGGPVAALGIAAILSSSSRAEVAGAEWTSRFSGVTGAVYAAPYDKPRLKAGPSGQTFAYGFVESGRREPGVTRFGGDITTPIWSAISPFIEESLSSESELIPLPDGSAIFVSTTLSRFASDGSLAWSIPKDDLAVVILLPSGDLLAAFRGQPGLNGSVVRRLSATTGATLESLRIGSGCSDLKLASAPDFAYLWSGCSSQVIQLRTNPLHVEWTSTPNEPTASVIDGIVADASGVYTASSSQLRKLSAVDGHTAWEAVPFSGFFNDLAIDGTGNIVTSGTGIDRWNGITGANRWHYPETAVARVDSMLSAVFFAGSLPPAAPGKGFTGFAGRLDLTSGNIAWRHETTSGSAIQFFDTAVSGEELQVIGQDCTASINGSCTTLLWSTDAATGSTFQSAPLVASTGTTGTMTLEEGDRTLVATLEWAANGAQIHLRSYMNATGAILQESVTPIPFATIPWLSPWSSSHSLNVVRSGDGNVVATFGKAVAEDTSNIFYDATMMKIEVATGQRLWQKFLLDTSTIQTSVYISAPAADAEGNIAIGVLETYGWDLPIRRWVRKFNHVSGELIWGREQPFNPMSASAYQPPGVVALGGDVMTETPLGETGSGWTTLSGADGTTRWRNPVIHSRIEVLDENTAISFGSEVSQIAVRRFDMTTGAVQWTSTYSDPSDVSYSVAGAARGDQNDFYIGGTHRQSSLATNGLLLRIDLANGNIVWANRLALGPVSPSSRVNPRFVHDGRVFATQPFSHTFGYALSAFSTVDGVHSGSAYLYSSPLDQPHLPQHANSGVLGKSSTGQLLITGEHFDPGLPGELVLANWGNPLPGPNGALRVTLDLVPASASTAITHTFAFETINDGSVTANEVQALLSLPAGTMVESATCQLSGSACVAITTATSVEGLYTIPAGATLRIAGTAKLIPTNAPLNPQSFMASSFAPHPFSELDLKDNVVSVVVADLIFRNGFD